MLVSRNVIVGTLRTSMRLEPEFWAALSEIAEIENLSLDVLCTRIDARRGELSRTSAMRLFATAYFAVQNRGTEDLPGAAGQAVGDGVHDIEPVLQRRA